MKHLHLRSALLAAGILALLLAGTAFAGSKPKTITPKIGEYTGTATLSGGGTGTATAKVFKEGGKLLVFPAIPSTLTCANNQSIAADIGYPATPKGATATYKGSEKRQDSMIDAETTLKESFKFSGPTALSGTVSQEVPAGPSPLVVTPCSTGTVSFKLHLR
jgi:hypothetical protein